MSPGDLVRIEGDVVPMFHDSSLSNYALAVGGEVVVVVEPNSVDRAPMAACGLFAQVLHPKLGVCYIRKQRLEVFDESTTTLRSAAR
jgi:hypothetical protein